MEGYLQIKTPSFQNLLGVFNILVIMFIVAPLLFVVAISFTPTDHLALPPGGRLSLRWFIYLFQNEGFINSFIQSVYLALAASAIATAIGILGAFGIVRYQFKGRNLLETLFISPLTIPAAVLGLSLLQFVLFIGWYDWFISMLAAHVVLTIPYVIRMVGASLRGIDPLCERAAQNLGATWVQVLIRVTLPLIRPAVLAGFLFAFLISFDNLTVSLFVAGPNMETLPIKMFNYIQDINDPLIAAVSTTMIMIAVGLMLVFERVLGVQKLFQTSE
jgi:putative spermidine/putrescine transport system permease protein